LTFFMIGLFAVLTERIGKVLNALVFSLTSYLSYVFPIHTVCFNSHGKTDRVNRS
jgi:hypothetical protein